MNKEIAAIKRMAKNAENSTGSITPFIYTYRFNNDINMVVDCYEQMRAIAGLDSESTWDVDEWEKYKARLVCPASREGFRQAYRAARMYLKDKRKFSNMLSGVQHEPITD